MAATAHLYASTPTKGRLRPVDARRDLNAIADLIELCFHDTLDQDGKSFLNQLRNTAQAFHSRFWSSTVAEQAPIPVSGYIWEAQDRLVGNLSLIPIKVNGRRSYLIANVAVHPDYRGQGIARTLTHAALEYIRSRRSRSAWLQVREDNAAAVHIYRSEGFAERARRTTWYGAQEPGSEAMQPGYTIGERQARHWPQQRVWLQRLYPAELDWHIPIDWNALRPDIWGMVYRFFSLSEAHHWVVQRDHQLLGAISWQRTSAYADPLWLAIPENNDEGSIHALLSHIRQHLHPGRRLVLNTPAGLAPKAIQSAGFFAHQTLIWMEMLFT